ncbi:MAG: hypothetical protein PHE51_12205 [Eubacteriales bacterium]|nr:hypothetical protein [Eubacteriales bacterium]
MKVRRIVSVLLVACILFSFSACKKAGNATSDASQENNTSWDVSAVSDELNASDLVSTESGANAVGSNKTGAPGNVGSTSNSNINTADLKANLNFNGATITILREWGAYERGKATVWDNWLDRVAEVEKKYNVKIIEKKWSVTLAQEALSGSKPEGNLYQISSGEVYNYINAGYLADYNTAMNETGIDMTSSIYNNINVQLNNINGKQYTAGYGEARVPTMVIFNKSIVEGLGYDIYSLMDSKQWTWDKMTEIAQKATKRDASGAVTQYGLGINTDTVAALSVSNGGKVGSIDSDGSFSVALDSQPVRESMQQLYQWCNVDKVAKYNWGNLQWDALDNDFAAGKVAMYFGGHNSISQAYANLSDDWGIAYLPMGPRSSDYVSLLTDEYSYVIPLAYKDNAKDYLLLLDELYQPYSGYTVDDQYRDEWIRYFKDAQAYNTFKALHRTVNQVWDPSIKFNVGSDNAPYSSVIGKLFQGTITVGTLVDTYQTAYETGIKDRYAGLKYTGSIK